MSQGKKRPWRPPDTEQDKLEKQTASLILAFLKSGKISGKNFTVAQDKQAKLEQDLAQLLQQAHDLGMQYGQAMIKHQEAAAAESIVGDIATFLKRAKDIVSGLISRVSNAVADVISGGGNTADVKDTVDGMFDYIPDQTSGTIIHDEVESGVDEVFDDESVEYVDWVCEPDACGVCLDNQSAGPIKRGEEFPSGHKRPVAHIGCRCNLVPSEEDE